MTQKDIDTVQSLMLETWQPVAAIAARASIPVCSALSILNNKVDAWGLQRVRVRIDGKNPVHCFRVRAKSICVLGVWMVPHEVVDSEDVV